MRKYRNKPVNGYASKAEAKRAAELKLLEKAGIIVDLAEQVRFELIPKQDGERGIFYIADFFYADAKTGVETVEDVKGVRTRDYVIKRKLMLWRHGIRISEIA